MQIAMTKKYFWICFECLCFLIPCFVQQSHAYHYLISTI